MTINEPSTIAAISTPPGIGGIGIVRISGPLSDNVVKTLFRPKNISFKNDPTFRHGKVYTGHLVDPDNTETIDEAIVFIMKGPHSYTGEDVLEFQVHGSPIVLHTLLERILTLGVVLAEPGEFTKRAFLNGRIDLIQAESIIDLIHAKTRRAAAIAISLLKGDLGNRFQQIKSDLADLLCLINAAIDFPDEEIDIPSPPLFCEQIDQILDKDISFLINSYKDNHYLRDGVKVGIAGPPNVGKSSLLNCLLQKEKAIVTPIPGTTRDIIEDAFNLNGIPIIMSDTAGIHETDDPVESIGICKARCHLKDRDIVLLVLDASKEIGSLEKNIYGDLSHQPVILVLNKMDLVEPHSSPDTAPFKNVIETVLVSAKYHQGIPELKGAIIKAVHPEMLDSAHALVPNLRQQMGLEFIRDRLGVVKNGILESLPFELIAIDLQACIDKIGEITGDNTPMDIFDRIFERFCIGK